MIRCTVGVFAHNEAHNVERALHAILSQQLHTATIIEIIVVASGCTDTTVDLAQEIARRHPIVSVEVEQDRRGKASAIRRLMSMARGDVIVLVGADTLPAPNAIEHLVAPFADREVGMTGARVVPLNNPATFLGFAVQMLWYVHHHLALRQPKLGELVACRNIIADFPEDTSTDDLALEALVTRKGLRLVYTPEAIVYNRGPEVYGDFMIQRRRIFTGELRVALKYRYIASSLSLRHLVPLVFDAVKSHPRSIPWTLAVMALEFWARLLGAVDALRGREAVVWRPARTTKNVVKTSEPVTLVSLRWPPDTLGSATVMLEVERAIADVGSVFWWDHRGGEALLKLDDAAATADLQLRLSRVTAAKSFQSTLVTNPMLISSRLADPTPGLGNANRREV